jgi:hypothetical protein
LGLRETTTLAAAIVGMDAGDVNGDGRTDVALAVMHDYMSPGDAGVLLGQADGTFTPTTFYQAAPAVTDVAIADLNADGRPDLAVAGWNPNSAAIFEPGVVVALRNLGGATFGDRRSFGFVGAPARLATGLLNRDRLPDVAATVTRGGSVAVLLNSTKSIFSRGVPVTATQGMPLVDQPVARFTVTGARPTPDAFAATILWGDGTGRSEAKVVANDDGTYSVLGNHTYRRWGIFRVTVYIRWGDADETELVHTYARVAPGPRR